MPWCYPCDRYFHSDHSLQQHLDNSAAHVEYECETCTRTFASDRACDQHMDALDHWAPKFECDTCTAKFKTQRAANQHMEARGHWSNYCADCDRRFENENNLRMHLNSRIHRGTGVECPFCKRGFVTASGVSHHLETGSCPNAPTVNRQSLYHNIRSRDSQGFITDQKQLEWHSEMSATERSWNGYNYECYLCHREFSELRTLNRHLNSPIHQQKLYHCPNRQCSREFVSLAAMFNHLESETCQFIRFGQVQQRVTGILTGRQRLIGFS
ncbi:hypothetical protein FN846DRAFT_402905 [Sphaerosporella brunnea]|uniref:C2H2-type domain-containing protein n=1 Tax=Sphaerosporella brunnea TaxID=1250544 RepID=A0A5J5EHW0_9PEZI|nr:hypothetical protein FN846DRAFT_402905 [Sphaerosporella brunnea]